MKMTGVRFLSCAAIILPLAARADVSLPSIVVDGMTQASDRAITITYSLENGPAVVTLDIQEKVDGQWRSIGEENIYGGTTRSCPQGDVSKVVDKSVGTIVWRPSDTLVSQLSGKRQIRAALTAWPLDDTPDYMAVSLLEGVSDGDRVRYYASSNAVPGGVLGNPAYRTSHVLLRKIMAKDVVWTMGVTSETGHGTGIRDAAHTAMLTNNFYIAVFPTTQAQWKSITSSKSATLKVEGAMRAMESICFDAVRCCAVSDKKVEVGTEWPQPPYSQSWLGLLRNRTKLDFDLPGEGQWEFACRAGYGDGYWGTGAPITSKTDDPAFPGRFKYNQAIPENTTSDASYGPENCTPIVGSYAPNAWGIYDQCGCVREMCLDWSQNDISALNGLVNTTVGTKHIIRGGDWKSPASEARPAFRDDGVPTAEAAYLGFRVVCRAGLK